MTEISKTWIDHNGAKWKTPTIIGRLKFECPGHAALRAFVFQRDVFTCLACGAKAIDVPSLYTGRHTLGTDRGWCLVMDHIVPRCSGGAHHPSNLRTFCDSCNAKKGSSAELRNH